MVYTATIDNVSIYEFTSLWYQNILNGISQFEMAIAGITSTRRANITTNKEVYIYREGVTVFRGYVQKVISMQGGLIIVQGVGLERDLSYYRCPTTGTTKEKVYNTSTVHDIFIDIMSAVTGWTYNLASSTNANVTSFRTQQNMSCWEGIIRIVELSGKDIGIDQVNKIVYLYDTKGVSDAFIFNETIDIGDVQLDIDAPKASKVVVYGKGDGEFQIVGTAGSGVPIKEIYDPNIVEQTTADARAAKELSLIQTEIKHYTFSCYNPNQNINTGDNGTINADSVGLYDTTVDVTKVKRTISGDENEKLSLEVTNPENRVASKNPIELNQGDTNRNDQRDGSMQGSGNLSVWSTVGPASNTHPLTIIFNVDDAHFKDQSGVIQIAAMTLDYDVDPYIRNFGSGSVSGGLLPVINKSDDNDVYSVVTYDDHNESAFTLNDTWIPVVTFNNVPADGQYIVFHVFVSVYEDNMAASNPAPFYLVRIYNHDTGEYYPHSDGIEIMAGRTTLEDDNGDTITGNTFGGCCTIICPQNPYFHDFRVEISMDYTFAYSESDIRIRYYVESQHEHNAGTYEADASGMSVIIGDGVSDAGSLNATLINMHLDYWNGSSWDLDKGIYASTDMLHKDLDISVGHTMPDATGIWRFRMYTNNAVPDTINAILKIKHYMDN